MLAISKPTLLLKVKPFRFLCLSSQFRFSKDYEDYENSNAQFEGQKPYGEDSKQYKKYPPKKFFSNENSSNGDYSKHRNNSKNYNSNNSKNYNREQSKSRPAAILYKKLGGEPTSNDFIQGIIEKVEWEKLNLTKIRKNFYQDSGVPQHSNEEITKFLDEHDINLRSSDKDMKDPFLSFDNKNLPEFLVKELKKAGFAKPSPIQAISWPNAIAGKDLISIAQTGSGKTLGYLIPMLIHIMDQPKLENTDGPIGLVLAPTRELALQIEDEVLKFGFHSKLRSLCCFGGVDKFKQRRELEKGCDIVISTPGRLIDFLQSGVTNLFRVTYLVLDEADRMLDMGFEPQIRRIISQIRPDRQTLMLSATWPKEVQQLARDFIRNPIQLQVGNSELSLNSDIKQGVEIVNENEKSEKLVDIIKMRMADSKSKILIFCKTKRGCETISSLLNYKGFNISCLHGDRTQYERDGAMEKFKTGLSSILVATDVAARGLDVKDIGLVVNYDFPQNIEDYVHRIGRTGRAGAKGESYSFITKDDERIAKDLIRIMKATNQNIPNDLYKLNSYNESNRGYGNGSKNYNSSRNSRSNGRFSRDRDY